MLNVKDDFPSMLSMLKYFFQNTKSFINIYITLHSLHKAHYNMLLNIQSIQGPKNVLFVLRFYGPVNPMGVMSSAVSLPNHTFTGQA